MLADQAGGIADALFNAGQSADSLVSDQLAGGVGRPGPSCFWSASASPIHTDPPQPIDSLPKLTRAKVRPVHAQL